MAKRGRPPKAKSETTVANEAPKKRGPKPKATATSEVKKPISLSELNQRELASLKKEIREETIKECMRLIVNPIVKEFNKLDK